ncbi:MAG TPA: prolyl-tRNA synthetase associated domain-containing protein [Vicinamibacterales bacterium]|nr:prolyl-tRNA synthetase associated domain-containing protein [Vicinamibacterales bacterium]
MSERSPAEAAVYETLDALQIRWTRYEHPPVFTVEEAQEHWAAIPATHCKNLLLRNKKGSTHYLVIVESSKRVDIGSLTRTLNEDRLSFASAERLAATLGLTPGSVSPFGLIHPGAKDVRVAIDADLRAARDVAFHPNVNTATIVLAWGDFERFLRERGNIVRYVRVQDSGTPGP